ncbi:glycoside hydrolase family 88/105 protein [Marinoscillum furvescens]|uniref:Rhamnogalacturonyl hydrolase YesR n=1 Tax=Marinoscillum furvescens DSM 4134 TaxID=1122208 RepID=A0A3D9LHM0_MARFU|nr:glycoside hydrolase family 88 protein [Marinoscillum furvescens]REE05509.1 rhamnogalacturonyl hydrolase YesR [Marinoscillum furvescens DSM 4134]
MNCCLSLVWLQLVFSCAPQSEEIAYSREQVLQSMQLANDYFMEKWPDPSIPIVGRKTWPSHIWTRGVYYEGLMALHSIYPKEKYIDYAVSWAEAHDWSFRYGITTRNADSHCAGQTYLDLYELGHPSAQIDSTRASIDLMVASDKVDDWDWIDAIQMAMPVFSKLGRIKGDSTYFEKMYELYAYSKYDEGGGLYNEVDGLWWRDADYVPPYTEPNGEDCYWSRGNGWVVAALVRVLNDIPVNEPHRQEYEEDLIAMLDALIKVQRTDGFWNASLHDPENYGGPEATGTALFVYGMAWGLNQNLIDSTTYYEPMARAWNALLEESLQPNGFLGYVQSTGKDPSAGQPVTQLKEPDFEDYGLGCFLLAGSEIYKLLDEQ